MLEAAQAMLLSSRHEDALIGRRAYLTPLSRLVLPWWRWTATRLHLSFAQARVAAGLAGPQRAQACTQCLAARQEATMAVVVGSWGQCLYSPRAVQCLYGKVLAALCWRHSRSVGSPAKWWLPREVLAARCFSNSVRPLPLLTVESPLSQWRRNAQVVAASWDRVML